jgi:hypothetical protein
MLAELDNRPENPGRGPLPGGRIRAGYEQGPERILADLKPEAAYFFADDNGQRSGSIVFDMKDTSQIPAVAEPWFLAFNAKASFRPIMNPQDLATAGPSIVKAAEQYGK